MTILTGSGSILILLKASGELRVNPLIPAGIKGLIKMEKNKYLLSVIVAKRAKQLLAGAKPFDKN